MNKPQINKKNIFRIFYLVIIIINIVFLFFLKSFIEEHVYSAMVLDSNYLLQNKKTNLIDEKRFENALENLKQKKTAEKLNIKDIFN
ncbi:hypothetical protein A2331_01450 [Candidatus Falkowbacteria bacterium RIFOXYB2_FULL_34_18]|uniref:Uncharacterized protein n=1 Tax=Candidatus Falkowbacteria bacterium RIFOXYD2_FULL_34_120 TaxID=1798007 RepID=A0A1F5TPL5_9BACT|nr:MAG: hypothetical protein A2331_01450 [Candidatus Falkowbacteria bacterium RIFOXYB2_FULL_34_18]OGF29281.1 MAG: hypothetical protein A2500_05330 [Candidatus Falkowbacteria bacterium RIFOXYC12_FULL_34_55]OGF36397.1 MAG: hypothetical protein A2466_00990 [Candidatus Falkowbacteria bacterium RIFOXYC2_FULL_34_220]OGF38876.1 MAG: hypothetical protein A2515_05750 [Candidatus Falkowbacteria bacterium RIFOXYD12_FULL_34_57]OGF40895.1 MAG: hypothetical protein A2531_03975 [Candidatus Falkowbacteria bact